MMKKNGKKVKKAPVKKEPVKKVKAETKKIEGTEKRNFILLSWDGYEIGKYTGRAPRQAALKAANRGVVDILLREAGKRKVIVRKKEKTTYVKIHYFKGGRVTRPKTKSDPEWMNDPVSTPTAVKMGSVWVPLHETALKLAITGTK